MSRQSGSGSGSRENCGQGTENCLEMSMSSLRMDLFAPRNYVFYEIYMTSIEKLLEQSIRTISSRFDLADDGRCSRKLRSVKFGIVNYRRSTEHLIYAAPSTSIS